MYTGGNQRYKCGVFLCRCDGSYMLGPGSGIIRVCSPVKIGVAYWSRRATVGVGFVLAAGSLSSTSSLQMKIDVEPSVPPAPFLLGCYRAPVLTF